MDFHRHGNSLVVILCSMELIAVARWMEESSLDIEISPGATDLEPLEAVVLHPQHTIVEEPRRAQPSWQGRQVRGQDYSSNHLAGSGIS